MGRPSKYTPTVHGKIVGALKAGAFFSAACKSAGVGVSTGWLWRKQGDTEPDGTFGQFAADCGEAEGVAEVGMGNVLIGAAKGGDWRAASWLLERRHAARWGQQIRVKAEQIAAKDVAAFVDRLLTEFGDDLGTLERIARVVDGFDTEAADSVTEGTAPDAHH